MTDHPVKPVIDCPFTVGLTGGIGSGKSTVSERFETLGAHIIDADVLARQRTLPGQPDYDAIVAHFGSTIIGPSGKIDRPRLAEIIFNQPAEKRWLEQRLHPGIRCAMKQQIQSSTAPYVVAVIPLLIEHIDQYALDRICLVVCDRATQIQRLMTYRGYSLEMATARLDAQMSQSQRRPFADDILDNNGSKEQLEPKIIKLHQYYLHCAARARSFKRPSMDR